MARNEGCKGFLLRLDAETMRKVEAWASREFRSVNGQIQWIIHDSLFRHGLIGKNGDGCSDVNITKDDDNGNI